MADNDHILNIHFEDGSEPLRVDLDKELSYLDDIFNPATHNGTIKLTSNVELTLADGEDPSNTIPSNDIRSGENSQPVPPSPRE